MLVATNAQCPNCNTVFRVTAEQIKVRNGLVRCGLCNQVFNAITSARANVEKKPTVNTTSPNHSNSPTTKPSKYSPIRQLNLGKISKAYATILDPNIDHEAARLLARKRWWSWALASLIALIALFIQVVIYFRSEIVATAVAERPLLVALCKPFGCQVSLPVKKDLLYLESSDVHPLGKGRLVLLASLRNRASYAMQYPHLELTLTDIQNKPILRRVLKPDEFLPPKVDIDEGFASKSEVNLSLELVTGKLKSAGYQLVFFYP